MALLIVSSGALAGSGLHTVRSRTLIAALGAVLLAVLAGGTVLGFRLARDYTSANAGAFPGAGLLDPTRPENQVLIERIGELSGRLIRLESEAGTLARRVGGTDDANPASRSTAAAPEPSGGPLVAADSDPLAATDEAVDRNPAGQLARIEHDLDRVEATILVVAQAATLQDLDSMALPSRSPIDGGRISSGFGNRRDPFTHRLARHTGIDLPARFGAPIHASAGGRVRFAGQRSAYGRTVEIDHGNGLVTRYGHASKLYVRRGDIVLPGQLIAAVGSTGRSTGPHVHFEVIRNGAQVEPRLYLARAGS